MKPYDVLKRFYGDKTDTVIKLAVAKHDMKDLWLGMVFDVDKIYLPVPVVDLHPDQLGDDNSAAFCSDCGGNKFCVVPISDDESSLAHELTHAMQIKLRSDYICEIVYEDVVDIIDPQYLHYLGFIRYLLDPHEFAVRISQFKRDYFKKTGIILGPDKSKIDLALHQLLLDNPQRQNDLGYHNDTIQLVELISWIGDKDALLQIIDLIIETLPKVVSTQNQKLDIV
jgi:hypothetical protein